MWQEKAKQSVASRFSANNANVVVALSFGLNVGATLSTTVNFTAQGISRIHQTTPSLGSQLKREGKLDGGRMTTLGHRQG